MKYLSPRKSREGQMIDKDMLSLRLKTTSRSFLPLGNFWHGYMVSKLHICAELNVSRKKKKTRVICRHLSFGEVCHEMSFMCFLTDCLMLQQYCTISQLSAARGCGSDWCGLLVLLFMAWWCVGRADSHYQELSFLPICCSCLLWEAIEPWRHWDLMLIS